MTLLLSSRIGQFALAAAAVALILVAFDAPAVTEAAAGAQASADPGASEDFIFTLLLILFGAGFAVSAAVGGIIVGATSA